MPKKRKSTTNSLGYKRSGKSLLDGLPTLTELDDRLKELRLEITRIEKLKECVRQLEQPYNTPPPEPTPIELPDDTPYDV